MKPRWKSEWIAPAAWKAVSPRRMVQARTSFSPTVELRDHALQHTELGLGVLVARARGLARLLEPSLHHGEVRQRELARDDVMVAHRVHGPHHVHHVRVLEAADHVDDGVHLADMGEELVAQALALRGALHEPGDVHELDDRGDFLLRLDELEQPVEARVGHLNDADVGLDGAKGIVLRRGRLGGGERVEQRGLADVGEADDAETKHAVSGNVAHLTPSRTQSVTTSTSCGISASTCCCCSSVNGASTYSAQSSTPWGSGPMPILSRAYCCDWRAASMLLRPLCPPADPCARRRKVPHGSWNSSTTTSRPA